MRDIYVMGDLHGHYDGYVRVLTAAGLIDAQQNWTGGDAHLWQIGDFFDRGNQGTECVALTMALQQQAAAAGGYVGALLGNHEMMLLCVARFGDRPMQLGVSVRELWYRWGGVQEELERLTEAQHEWIRSLPLMARVGDRLLVHSDAIHYVDHGRTIAGVNRAFARLLAGDDQSAWERALAASSEHEAFSRLPVSGKRNAEMLLRCYGGAVLVHGHTPIAVAARRPAEEVTEPWEYADGICVNVDGGLYLGGPGFLYRFAADAEIPQAGSPNVPGLPGA